MKIKIVIVIDDNGKILDCVETNDPSFKDVACALLRLKQIEQKIINTNFKEDFAVSEEEE